MRSCAKDDTVLRKSIQAPKITLVRCSEPVLAGAQNSLSTHMTHNDFASEAGSLVEKLLAKFSNVSCPSFDNFMEVLSDSGTCLSVTDDELQCMRLYCEFIHSKMRKKDLEHKQELERRDTQLEKQAHQLQGQEDSLLQLMMLMKDTEKIMMKGSQERTKFEYGRPEEKGRWYWIFSKHQLNIKSAIKSFVPEVAHHLAKEGVISATMEKYFLASASIPSDSIADELVKAIQVSLDHNPENFKKVVDVLKSTPDSSCQRMGDRLAQEYDLSNKDRPT